MYHKNVLFFFSKILFRLLNAINAIGRRYVHQSAPQSSQMREKLWLEIKRSREKIIILKQSIGQVPILMKKKNILDISISKHRFTTSIKIYFNEVEMFFITRLQKKKKL